MVERSSYTLPNGLSVCLESQPGAACVAMSALVCVGAMDDPTQAPGLSHLLEHMLFRGSKRYRTACDLLLPFELGGGSLEAETWRDHTHYSAEVAPPAAPAALRALGDMLASPRLVGLRAEKRLVAAEIELDLDDDGHEADLHALTRRAVWLNHPLARRITGTLESVAQITKKQLAAHHRQFYGARNIVLSIAGPMDMAAMQRIVAAAFAGLAMGERARPQQPLAFTPASELTLAAGSSSQLSLQLSFAASPLTHRLQPFDEAVAGVLGEGMLSRLQVALSEQSGLVYAFDAGLDVYACAATYDIEWSAAPERAPAALATVIGVLETLAEHGPSVSELTCLAARRRLEAAREQTRPSEAAYQRGLHLMFGKSAQAVDFFSTAATARVRDAARRLLLEAPKHLFVCGSACTSIEAKLADLWRAFCLRHPSGAAAANSPADKIVPTVQSARNSGTSELVRKTRSAAKRYR